MEACSCVEKDDAINAYCKIVGILKVYERDNYKIFSYRIEIL